MCKFLCKQELETLAYVREPDIFVGGALLLVLDPSTHSDKPTEKLCFQSFYNVKVLALVTLAPLFRVESFFTVFPWSIVSVVMLQSQLQHYQNYCYHMQSGNIVAYETVASKTKTTSATTTCSLQSNFGALRWQSGRASLGSKNCNEAFVIISMNLLHCCDRILPTLCRIV